MLLTRVLDAKTLVICGINTDTRVYSTMFSAGNHV